MICPTESVLFALSVCFIGQQAQVIKAFGVTEPESSLLNEYAADITSLKEEAKSIVGSDALDQAP